MELWLTSVTGFILLKERRRIGILSTTIVDEDGKVINTLAFSQRKGERKLKVVQSDQTKVEVNEKK